MYFIRIHKSKIILTSSPAKKNPKSAREWDKEFQEEKTKPCNSYHTFTQHGDERADSLTVVETVVQPNPHTHDEKSRIVDSDFVNVRRLWTAYPDNGDEELNSYN